MVLRLSSWPQMREQWHVVCGAVDAQPWPRGALDSCDGTANKAGANDADVGLRASLMHAEAVLRRVAMCTLACAADVAMARGDVCAAELAELRAKCTLMRDGTDPSVLDAFHYLPREDDEERTVGEGGEDEGGEGEEPELAMAAHYDPGVLTLTRASDVPGLQI